MDKFECFKSDIIRCQECESMVKGIIVEGYVHSIQCLRNGHGYTFSADMKVSLGQLESPDIDSLSIGFYFDPYTPRDGQDVIDNLRHQLQG